MFKIDEFIKGIHGELYSYKGFDRFREVSIDTRTLEEGDCYFALRGEYHDGHEFIKNAYVKGAAACVIDRFFLHEIKLNASESFGAYLRTLPNVILVDETLSSLGHAASWRRGAFRGYVVGITGSCGKTTTKEYAQQLLSAEMKCCATKGNFNNAVGLPLTLLNFDSSVDLLIAEMGASHVKDIEYLSRILKPTVGILTNVQLAHLESFGDIENIYRAKLELAEYLDSINGTLILYGDDDKLVREARKYHINLVTFGKNKTNDFYVSNTEATKGTIKFEVNGSHSFSLNSYGSFNVYNALAAVALADHFNCDLSKLGERLRYYNPIEGRFNIYHGSITIIDDTYNASPYSFEKSLQAFAAMKNYARKIVVCGDMKELGETSVLFHKELGDVVALAKPNLIIGVGMDTPYTLKEAKKRCPKAACHHFSSNQDIVSFLKDELRDGDIVLIKGSRGNKLDEVVRALVEAMGCEQRALSKDIKPMVHGS